jgi:hypothetical protein
VKEDRGRKTGKEERKKEDIQALTAEHPIKLNDTHGDSQESERNLIRKGCALKSSGPVELIYSWINFLLLPLTMF